MTRNLPAVVLFVVLAMTAGCLGFGGDEDPGPGTPTAEATPTPAATPTPETTPADTPTVTPTVTPTATPTPAPAEFNVTIRNTNAPPSAGSELVVLATITNTGDLEGTQNITLDVSERGVVNSTSVTLAGGQEEIVRLVWQTSEDDVGQSFTVTVNSDDDSAEVTEN
ncbi:MAG: hypothetical protein ACI8XM_003100 [Haloarculaceae archaeon]|jgi:hypothetical protein